MVSWPEPLVSEVAERRVVFFIGSGVSKNAHDAFPVWKELLRETLAPHLSTKKDRRLVKSLVNQGRLLDAAEVVRSGLAWPMLGAELRRVFDIRPLPHKELYESILTMDPKTVITTNYDRMIEDNFHYYSGGEASHIVRDISYQRILSDFRSPTRSIIKLHGCISTPEEVILDRTSYAKQRGSNPGLYEAVSALMTVNTVVFLGYSVTDPDIQLLLENMNRIGFTEHPHYALVSKMDHPSLRDSYKEAYNVHFLEYAKGQHQELSESINNLKERVREFRRSRAIV